ncbi:hypothetical protein CWS35_31785 [Bradyrhizobium sp. SK17]|uniref:formyltransferase family protein n=1 Tax=Bradyrhizobium sp. SK17 TaxID=2057741 RepID=UPI000C319D8E|nr:formyltransferase family protein [Bradyrhizobium sp. SK17]AUC98322.1 hypothetical protein CWS35_31785 [Bradyrhizobium sp. SK17]
MRKLIFLGQRQIAWKAMEILARRENREAFELAVLVTDVDTRVRAERELGFAPRFLANDRRRTEQIVSAIREEEVSLLISIQHNWIISPDILEAVNGDAYNLHNARLPHYQGYNSISHAILNGDGAYYSTIHWMEEKVDSGAIAFEAVTAIGDGDTALSLHRKTIHAAINAFEQLMATLRSGRPIPRRPLSADVEPKFYGRNSLKEILDVTAIRDPDQLSLYARALFYPPHNMAFQLTAKGKTYLVPQSGLLDLRQVVFSVEEIQ